MVGETCTDEYVFGECSRLSPEAPVPVMLHSETQIKQGMALNVVNNLEVLSNAEISFITQQEQIRKIRYVDKKFQHQILRLDIHPEIESLPTLPSDWGSFDCIVISDYDKGFLSYRDIKYFADYARDCGIPIFIDSKKPKIITIDNAFIKVNDDEYEKMIGPWVTKNLIRTRGADGADYCGVNYPAPKVDVYDVCGAGDTFLAALVHFYLTTGSIETAIPYANKAGAIAVSHFGTYVLTKEDVDAICN